MFCSRPHICPRPDVPEGLSLIHILLKRAVGATVEELLQSAEYILSGGNPNVVLCERGVRSFSKTSRAALDVSVIPVLKQMTHLPVIVDPSPELCIRDRYRTAPEYGGSPCSCRADPP